MEAALALDEERALEKADLSYTERVQISARRGFSAALFKTRRVLAHPYTKRSLALLAFLLPIIAAAVIASEFNVGSPSRYNRSSRNVEALSCFRAFPSSPTQCQIEGGVSRIYQSSLANEIAIGGGALEILCWTTGFDPVAYLASISCNVRLWGTYKEPRSYNQLARTADPITIEFDQASSITVQPCDPVGSPNDLRVGVSVPRRTLEDGVEGMRAGHGVYDYPRNEYDLTFVITAFFLPKNVSAPPGKLTLFFSWISSSVSSWDLNLAGTQTEEDLVNSTLAPSFTVSGIGRLNASFRRYIEALNVLMWMLSLATVFCILLLLLQSWYSPFLSVDDGAFGKDTVARWVLLTFSGTLLFALPTVRGLWPMATGTGTSYDLASVFGQLCLVFAAALVLALDSAIVLARRILR